MRPFIDFVKRTRLPEERLSSNNWVLLGLPQVGPPLRWLHRRGAETLDHRLPWGRNPASVRHYPNHRHQCLCMGQILKVPGGDAHCWR